MNTFRRSPSSPPPHLPSEGRPRGQLNMSKKDKGKQLQPRGPRHVQRTWFARQLDGTAWPPLYPRNLFRALSRILYRGIDCFFHLPYVRPASLWLGMLTREFAVLGDPSCPHRNLSLRPGTTLTRGQSSMYGPWTRSSRLGWPPLILESLLPLGRHSNGQRTTPL